MSDALGTKLKRAREASGVALRDIAVATKISVSALEALERNDFSRLPGGIFSRAFVRGYAIAVGLDPEATVQEFLAEITRSESEAARVATEHPEVTPEDRAFLDRQRRAIRLLQIAGVLVVIAIATGGAFAWMKWTRSEAQGETSPRATPSGAAAAPAAAPPPASPPAETPPAATTRPPPAAPDPTAAAGAPPATVVPPETPPPVPVTPQQQDPLTLEFEVTSPSFVEIAADGKVSFSKAMEPGDRQRIQAVRELRLKVGDAGAFIWSLNGKPARALGEAGVAKSARVTRSNFKRFLR